MATPSSSPPFVPVVASLLPPDSSASGLADAAAVAAVAVRVPLLLVRLPCRIDVVKVCAQWKEPAQRSAAYDPYTLQLQNPELATDEEISPPKETEEAGQQLGKCKVFWRCFPMLSAPSPSLLSRLRAAEGELHVVSSSLPSSSLSVVQSPLQPAASSTSVAPAMVSQRIHLWKGKLLRTVSTLLWADGTLPDAMVREQLSALEEHALCNDKGNKVLDAWTNQAKLFRDLLILPSAARGMLDRLEKSQPTLMQPLVSQKASASAQAKNTLARFWLFVLRTEEDGRQTGIRRIAIARAVGPEADMVVDGRETNYPLTLPEDVRLAPSSRAHFDLRLALPEPAATVVVPYVFDPTVGVVTACFCFHSTEAARMVQLVKEGQLAKVLGKQEESIIELGAGPGLYTLPLLVASRSCKVIACDRQARHVDAIKVSCEDAQIPNTRYNLRTGDALQDQSLEGCADRVIVGRGLPLEPATFHAALRMLQNDGGLIHVHSSYVEPSAEQDGAGLLTLLQDELAKEPHRSAWSVKLLHAERARAEVKEEELNGVKQKVTRRGVVFDIACSPDVTRFSTCMPTQPAFRWNAPTWVKESRGPTRDTFSSLVDDAQPALLREVNLGDRWSSHFTPEAMMRSAELESDTLDTLALNPQFNFHTGKKCILHWKHTENTTKRFSDVLRLAQDTKGGGSCQGDYVYLRTSSSTAVGTMPQFKASLPALAQDSALPLPPLSGGVDPLPLLSFGTRLESVLTVASPRLQLRSCVHQHQHSLLIHLHGKKRVVLFPSSDAMYAMRINNIDAPQSKIPADVLGRAQRADIEPGDVLFIPAGWIHFVSGADDSICVSVSMFWSRSKLFAPLDPTPRLYFYEYLVAERQAHGLVRLLSLLDAVQQCTSMFTKQHRLHYWMQLRKQHPLLFNSGSVSQGGNPHAHTRAEVKDLRAALDTPHEEHTSCCTLLLQCKAVKDQLPGPLFTAVNSVAKAEMHLEASEAEGKAAAKALLEAAQADAMKKDSPPMGGSETPAGDLLIDGMRRAVMKEHEQAYLRSQQHQRCMELQRLLLRRAIKLHSASVSERGPRAGLSKRGLQNPSVPSLRSRHRAAVHYGACMPRARAEKRGCASQCAAECGCAVGASSRSAGAHADELGGVHPERAERSVASHSDTADQRRACTVLAARESEATHEQPLRREREGQVGEGSDCKAPRGARRAHGQHGGPRSCGQKATRSAGESPSSRSGGLRTAAAQRAAWILGLLDAPMRSAERRRSEQEREGQEGQARQRGEGIRRDLSKERKETDRRAHR